ncbi:ABC transporter permease [Bacteroidia bacterium]|nr:ABC transporter permease [Bacteroidia bacterium]
MFNNKMIFSLLKKSKSLRIVNLIGLSVIFACVVVSYAYVKKELSYDRFNANADRIVRFSVGYENEPVDGRNRGFSSESQVMRETPEIESAVLFAKINTGVLKYREKSTVVNDFLVASSNFFEVFSYELLQGDADKVLDAPEKAVVSERFARQLFGDESPLGKEIRIEARRFSDKTLFISGVFADFPETSHFHTDLIVHRPVSETDWPYVYLLLAKGADIKRLAQNMVGKLTEWDKQNDRKAIPHLLPLTDIHLHSRIQRELEPNGNIYYIYLIAGANALLLLIVLFNLWLNAGLIFSSNRKYYQLLRLNGASSSVVLKDESVVALLLGGISIVAGGLAAYFLLPCLRLSVTLFAGAEIGIIAGLFLFSVWFTSFLPVFTSLSYTLFLNDGNDFRALHFSLSKVKYLLIAQYVIVMLVVIVGFGISKQVGLIKTSQVGGRENTILVMKEQPDQVKQRYDLLKTELLKYPEIDGVTSAMQLPGSAIRDALGVWKEGEEQTDAQFIPQLLVGNGFFEFFRIMPVAGACFQSNTLTYKEEESLLYDFLDGKSLPEKRPEEYIINRKAMNLLGFQSPEEAVGKQLFITQGTVDYINEGIICGVTDNFTYTTIYEEAIPLIILQRNMFQHCILVRLDPNDTGRALATFNRVWSEVNPDYPADYTFLQDVYGQVYRNEWNAESLVRLFSLLGLIIANLGLIVVMAFIIKRKTKEIGIRKINGASFWTIVRMLNSRFIAWIGIAFLIAVPGACFVMSRWLENFAHKTALEWWIFVFAGLFVLLISIVAVSWQSWRAATANPVEALKSE